MLFREEPEVTHELCRCGEAVDRDYLRDQCGGRRRTDSLDRREQMMGAWRQRREGLFHQRLQALFTLLARLDVADKLADERLCDFSLQHSYGRPRCGLDRRDLLGLGIGQRGQRLRLGPRDSGGRGVSSQHREHPVRAEQAHHALGPVHTLFGDWNSARAGLSQAIAHYNPREHGSHAFLYGGHDPGVRCLGYLAKSLWMLGFPEQALENGHDALVLAHQLGHPTSLAHTQMSVAILHQFRRDAAETLELAEALIRLAADQGLVFYLAGGMVLKGWAQVELGNYDEGLTLIRQGFETGGATRAHWRGYALALLAEALARGGSFTDGLAALGEAFAVVEKTGIRIFEPELHRLKGKFLLALDLTNSADAELCFQQAIALARHQKAKFLELRATMELCRHGHERFAEAHAALATLYGSFVEGFTTHDLVDASELLESQARPP
jgi:predicted ATPase